MSPKELTKLVKTCKKLGITFYKDEKVEFSISGTPEQATKPRKNAKAMPEITEDKITTDTPTKDELLWWSTNTTEESESFQ